MFEKIAADFWNQKNTNQIKNSRFDSSFCIILTFIILFYRAYHKIHKTDLLPITADRIPNILSFPLFPLITERTGAPFTNMVQL